MKLLLCRVADFLISPAVLLASVLLKFVRRVGVERIPVARSIFRSVGMFPIRNHYYEPLFSPSQLQGDLSAPRTLPGIDWNLDTQIATVGELSTFSGELPATTSSSFGRTDQAFWYGMIRRLRPKRIIEVGSGDSTRTAMQAIAKNGGTCTHICIEPYEQPWLDEKVQVLRECLENVDRALFATLEANDILFIDSSHVIRPQGDVLTEFLEILPTLKPGVVVHVHDIFSPRHYHTSWILDEVRFWNEQYLVEAFLSFNCHWEILVASNYLRHDHQMSIDFSRMKNRDRSTFGACGKRIQLQAVYPGFYQPPPTHLNDFTSTHRAIKAVVFAAFSDTGLEVGLPLEDFF
jgi:hypothetical protein